MIKQTGAFTTRVTRAHTEGSHSGIAEICLPRRSEESWCLGNVGKYSPKDTTSHSRRHDSSSGLHAKFLVGEFKRSKPLGRYCCIGVAYCNGSSRFEVGKCELEFSGSG
jgi:hypothetical protein